MKIDVNKDVLLKRLCLEDSEIIFDTISSQKEYLGEFLSFISRINTELDIVDFINNTYNEYVFCIYYKDNFAGLIGFSNTDINNKSTEIGYWISEKFQRKGIVINSVDILCDFAFFDLEINRIQIKCASLNHRSINIPKSLSFKFEGIQRDGECFGNSKYLDLMVYSKLKFEHERLFGQDLTNI